QLVRFERQHLCRVEPVTVQRLCEDGRNYIYVDIAFVGLRDMRDFACSVEQQEMWQQMRQVLRKSQIPEQLAPTHRRIVLGEFQMTLRKELRPEESGGTDTKGWLVDFYKVYGFRLVNYSPVTLQYRVIEFLKPV
ncbi:GH13922, partial [Drosophila grimshawi]